MLHYFTCPHCGIDVPISARACPECGSDRETGWSEAASYSHLLPDRGNSAPSKKRWPKQAIAFVAIFVLAAFLAASGLGWSIPILAVVGAIVYFARRQTTSGNWLRERQLYGQLLNRARGDRSLADRLVDYERRRSPNSTRSQWLDNAIYRWDRDRR